MDGGDEAVTTCIYCQPRKVVDAIKGRDRPSVRRSLQDSVATAHALAIEEIGCAMEPDCLPATCAHCFPEPEPQIVSAPLAAPLGECVSTGNRPQDVLSPTKNDG